MASTSKVPMGTFFLGGFGYRYFLGTVIFGYRFSARMGGLRLPHPNFR